MATTEHSKLTYKQRLDAASKAKIKVNGPGEVIRPPYQVFYAKPGETFAYEPGDVVLIATKDIYARFIRFGQALKYRKKRKGYTWCNHAAVVSWHKIYQATAKGIIKSDTNVFNNEYRAVIRVLDTPPEQLAAACTFAKWAVTNHEKYAFLTILGISISLIIGLYFSLGTRRSMICSAFGTRFLERMGFIPLGDPMSAMPADMACWFDVQFSGFTNKEK